MTRGEDVLYETLARRFAACGVATGPAGYHLTVRDEAFRGLDRADREGVVYDALGRVPLELLARVGGITCLTPDD